MQDEKVELYKDLLLGGNNENTQLMQELQLPYMFRGQALLAADNCLIFDDFYGQIYTRMSIIGLSISMVQKCGPSEWESIQNESFCQEGDIVVRDEKQRQLMVSRVLREQDM